MEPTETREAEEQRAPGALPPEVEAELRRRQRGELPPAPGEPLAPWLQAARPNPEEAPASSTVPPVIGTTTLAAPPAPAPPGLQERLRRLGPIGVFLAFLLKQLKILALLLKFGLPALKTGATMLISIFFYAQAFGWWFAVGFVLCIFAHEMGHVFVAWRLGLPVSSPLFIPFVGALILLKREARSAWEGALIGIGGPLAGLLAGLLCLLLHRVTGSPLMLALAYTGFAINLFNMAPIYPLDGGRIVGAVSPRLWLFGIVAMVVMFATGFIRNPLILLIILMSAPRLWHGLKSGDITRAGGVPTTPPQRLTMGLAYVSLCGLLVWLMAFSYPAYRT